MWIADQVLNVRDPTLKQMMANEDRFSDVPFADERFAELEDAFCQEIQNLIKIIGLDLNKES